MYSQLVMELRLSRLVEPLFSQVFPAPYEGTTPFHRFLCVREPTRLHRFPHLRVREPTSSQGFPHLRVREPLRPQGFPHLCVREPPSSQGFPHLRVGDVILHQKFLHLLLIVIDASRVYLRQPFLH